MEVGAVLHEAAHHMSPEAGHGEAFAKTYLDTVGSTLGEEAAKTLKTHFDEGGVRY
jgi:putative metallohydrolase (TIGR04338 family)